MCESTGRSEGKSQSSTREAAVHVQGTALLAL